VDDLVARIDAPLIQDFFMTLFNQIVFDTPQLLRFIGRTPNLKALNKACVAFQVDVVKVQLSSISSQTSPYEGLNVKISITDLDWQISSLEQVFTSCLPPLSMLKDLYIFGDSYWQPNSDGQKGNIENAQKSKQNKVENTLWLELLHPFTAVRNLYLSEEIAPRIVSALQELVGSRTTEVLPILENIFLEGLQPSGTVQEAVGQFVAARQVTTRPIAITNWESKLKKEEYKCLLYMYDY
jgi:hypothetical protein